MRRPPLVLAAKNALFSIVVGGSLVNVAFLSSATYARPPRGALLSHGACPPRGALLFARSRRGPRAEGATVHLL